MPLPYQTETLDDVPESARELYEEQDGLYVLPVDGAVPKDQVEGLEITLEKLKEERSRIKQMNDKDLKELNELREARRKAEEEKAKEEGRWDELRDKLQREHEERVKAKDTVIEKLAVRSQLKDALSEAGVLPVYLDDAYRALMEMGPVAKEKDGDVVGVFPDELHGDKPIADFVKEWAGSEQAEKYLPPQTGPGGGATGDQSRGGSHRNKSYADMTPDEKVSYLAEKYGDE